MKRWFIIRHIRYFFLLILLNIHLHRMRSIGFGFFANRSDLDYLDKVWEGKL